MVESHEGLVRRLFDAFNHRDAAAIVEICHPEMEFVAITAGEVGRDTPYAGPEGLREYLADVERAWEELLITPARIDRRGDRVLVRGRVYVRSRDLGIRDIPVAWIWQVRDGRFVSGEVCLDPEDGAARFARG